MQRKAGSIREAAKSPRGTANISQFTKCLDRFLQVNLETPNRSATCDVLTRGRPSFAERYMSDLSARSVCNDNRNGSSSDNCRRPSETSRKLTHRVDQLFIKHASAVFSTQVSGLTERVGKVSHDIGVACLSLSNQYLVDELLHLLASINSSLSGDLDQEIDKCLYLGGEMTVDGIVDGHRRALRHILVEDRNDSTSLKILTQQPPGGIDNA
jgi:hypothetical protein